MNGRSTIRRAQDSDAAQISKLVQTTVRTSNAQDYPASVIQRVSENFSAMAIRGFLERRIVLVTCHGADIVGTASLDGDVVRTVFVSPAMQGNGIGRDLMDAIEAVAGENGVTILRVPASVTANRFYERLGYSKLKEVLYGEERTIIMEKTLA